MLRPSKDCISIDPLQKQSRAQAERVAPAGTCSAVLGGGDPGWPELGPGTYQSRGVGGVVCAARRGGTCLASCRAAGCSQAAEQFFYLLSLKPSRNPELLMTD